MTNQSFNFSEEGALADSPSRDANAASNAEPIQLDSEELAIRPWNNHFDFDWQSYNLDNDCIRNWILNQVVWNWIVDGAPFNGKRQRIAISPAQSPSDIILILVGHFPAEERLSIFTDRLLGLNSQGNIRELCWYAVYELLSRVLVQFFDFGETAARGIVYSSTIVINQIPVTFPHNFHSFGDHQPAYNA